MGEVKNAFRPKIPERPEEGREEREADRCADEQGKEHIKTQLAVSDAQSEGKKRSGEEEAEKGIKQCGQGVVCAAAHAQCTQAVVEQGQCCAKQERGTQAMELSTDLNAHAHPPNRRAKSPPEEGASS